LCRSFARRTLADVAEHPFFGHAQKNEPSHN
jgi:hypothetical protein